MPKKRPKAEDWTDPTGLLLLQSWAQQGLSQDQICENMERLRGVPMDISQHNADSMGVDIMELTAHGGARTGDGGQDFTNHSWWQRPTFGSSGPTRNGTSTVPPCAGHTGRSAAGLTTGMKSSGVLHRSREDTQNERT